MITTHVIEINDFNIYYMLNSIDTDNNEKFVCGLSLSALNQCVLTLICSEFLNKINVSSKIIQKLRLGKTYFPK